MRILSDANTWFIATILKGNNLDSSVSKVPAPEAPIVRDLNPGLPGVLRMIVEDFLKGVPHPRSHRSAFRCDALRTSVAVQRDS